MSRAITTAHSLILGIAIYLTGTINAHAQSHDLTSLSFSRFAVNQHQDMMMSCTIKEQDLLDALRSKTHVTLTNFPIDPSLTGTIVLRRAQSVVDQNTIFVVPSAASESPLPEVHAFTGSIQGELGSTVRLVDVNGSLFVLIERSFGKSFVLAPTNDHDANYALMPSSAIRADLRNIWDQLPNGDGTSKAMAVPQALDWTKLLEVDLALETDTEFFNATGRDVQLAQAYAIALVQMTSEVYAEQVNIRFRLSWLKTWTNAPADPYNVKGDAYALPEKVRQYWADNYRDVPRDVAHVMTSISYGGGGFGFFNALCSTGEYAFSVSSVQGRSTYPTFAFTYDVYILAHELGHNFNATHTHSCAAGVPLDTCVVEDAIRDGCLDAGAQAKPNPGSIMSYCGGTNNAAGLGYIVRMEFLDFNKQQIRTAAEAAPCLEEPASPTLELTSLRGGEQLRPLQQVAITWRSARVANVNIEYSIDDAVWFPIVASVPSGSGSYTWTVADICTSTMRIRVRDADGGEASDTSMLDISVLKDDPDGLVAYYPFSGTLDDQQECHLYDLTGQATYVSDRSGAEGSALVFGGSTLVRNNEVPMDFASFSYTFWFLPSSLDGEQHLLGTSWEQQQAILQAHVWGQYGIAFWTGGGTPAQLWGGTPALNAWNHGAVTYDGSKISLYLNGLLRAEEPLTTPLAKRDRAALFVGGRVGKAFFRGAMDEVRYYKRSLGPAEISEMYNSAPVSVAGDVAPLVSWSVYPNPASELCTITFSQPVASAEIEVVDALGGVVVRANAAPDTQIVTLNLQQLPQGAYRVRVSSAQLIESHAVMVVR